MKKFVVVLVAVVLITTTTLAETHTPAPMVSGFSDVNQGDWYYDAVIKMTQNGYFTGKGEITNGIGAFAPNDTTTKAEFLTVCARILYGDNVPSVNGTEWWMPYYTKLADNGIIKKSEFSTADMNTPMTREEMALVAIRTMSARGEDIQIDTTKLSLPGGKQSFYNVELSIPDRFDIDDYYKIYVLKAYHGGIIQGVSESGSFLPKGYLTRAAASTVLYRIINPTVRKTGNEEDRPIIIYEGQERTNRIAKEGDTFVKADGTQIILKKGPNGILGEGQGVAPDVGLKSPMHHSKIEKSGDYMPQNMGTISTGGNSIDFYYINPLTGEGHWGAEWSAITVATAPLAITGKNAKLYDVTADKNFYWDGTGWFPIASHPEVYPHIYGK